MDDARIVFFGPNRVWRVYRGGKLLDDCCGNAVAEDGFFPEEWLASTTPACNGAHQQSADEGLSVILQADGTRGERFRDYLRAAPRATLGRAGYDEREGIGVLCKFLDAAIRLPIQCHPDVAFAKAHYHSNHGKAEAWIILNTRDIGGERPYLLMGFKPGVTPQAFRRVVETQDIAAMEQMLHKVPVERGDLFFIPGRFPHAIGPGVFMLEVQEPTDWVVQPEKSVGGVELLDRDMWGPVSSEVGLACFDYAGAADADETLRRVRITPREQSRSAGGRLELLLDNKRTGCFEVRRLELRGRFTLDDGGYVGIVTAGRCVMRDTAGNDYAVKSGQAFFVPACLRGLEFMTDASATIVMANGMVSPSG